MKHRKNSPTFLFLGSLFITQLAMAGSLDHNVSVSCHTKMKSDGQELQVIVDMGPVDAQRVELTEGTGSEASTQEFVVKKTESADLKIESYIGAGFAMTVNTDSKSANLKALISGQRLSVSGLKCEFSEHRPVPGVTISN